MGDFVSYWSVPLVGLTLAGLAMFAAWLSSRAFDRRYPDQPK